MKTVSIAVTGLKEAGKTVFLMSLIDHLLEGSEETLPAFQDEGITFSARQLPVPTQSNAFPYRVYLEGLQREPPTWPTRTEEVAEFWFELTLCNLKKRRTRSLKLKLTDYPGERLLDMPLLQRDYAAWSDEVVREAQSVSKRALSGQWLECCRDLPSVGHLDGTVSAYRDYLRTCREHGLTYLQPAGMLTHEEPASVGAHFCPLPAWVRESVPQITRRLEGHYNAYVHDYVRPFFKTTAQCTRQIVLVDVLRILRQGVHSYNDTRRCLRTVLDAFVYTTQRRLLSPLRLVDAFRRQISRVAFAATKADQCTRATRGNLRFLLEELVSPKRRQLMATLPDRRPRIMFCAAHRATEDAARLFEGRELSCLRGVREDRPSDMDGPWFPGEVPAEWPDDEWDPEREQFVFPSFLPPHLSMRDGAVIPHINLDKVFHYIIEDLIP